MAEIHVVFPKTGGVVVTQDVKAVLGGEFISWLVHSKNDNVKSVRVVFQNADAKFFPTDSGLKNQYEKGVTYGNGSGDAMIWGEAPVFAQDRKDDKYSVVGLDAKGQTLIEEDPMIITDRPTVPPIAGGGG